MYKRSSGVEAGTTGTKPADGQSGHAVSQNERIRLSKKKQWSHVGAEMKGKTLIGIKQVDVGQISTRRRAKASFVFLFIFSFRW